MSIEPVFLTVPQNTEELYVEMVKISARKIGKSDLAELFRELSK